MLSKYPSFLSRGLATGKLVRASTEKALRSIVKEPGGRVDAVASQGVALPFHPIPKTNKTFSGVDARTQSRTRDLKPMVIVVLYTDLHLSTTTDSNIHHKVFACPRFYV